MKTNSEKLIEKAQRLYDLKCQIACLEKEHAELRAEFMDKITDGLLEAGPIVMTLEVKSRTNFDKEALTTQMGAEFVKAFERVTEYRQLNVKSRAA